MVHEKELFLIRLMKITDALIIALSFYLAFFLGMSLRQSLVGLPLAFAPSNDAEGAMIFLKNHLWLVLITIPAWIGLMSADGVYENFRTKLLIEISWRIFRTGLLSVVIMGAVVFILQMTLTSRLYVAVFAMTAFLGLIANKAIWKKVMDVAFRRGYNLVNLLIVGSGPRAQEFIKVVREHANWGLNIVGIVDDDPKLLGKHVLDYEIIGRIRDIPRLLREYVIDRVIFVIPRLWLNRIEAAIEHCEMEGIDTAVAINIFHPKLAQIKQSHFAQIPLLLFQTTNAKEWQIFLKRIVDLLISLIALIVLSPLLICIIIVIKISSPGPVFFRQKRVGMNGRLFTLYKFRSMVIGAEMRKRELERSNEMSGPAFKMRRDPRVTKFGRFMRRFSLDEYPQLFNVLKGDMSLVGPRPPLPTEVEMYEVWQRRRLSMKPGITCLWQVSGRNRIDFNRWMEMDLQYIDNFSLWFDFTILVRTLFVVLTGYGAS
jgi:exopolysaccharide biosynthesis polyprenyl glycosylphosphotransferase